MVIDDTDHIQIICESYDDNMLRIAEDIYLATQSYSDRLKFKLKTGMSHGQLDRLLDYGSPTMSVVRVAEHRIAVTYECENPKKCTLDELVYLQWTSGNVTNKQPEVYDESKYGWNRSRCVTSSWPSEQTGVLLCPEIVHYLEDGLSVSIS
jgi:hypothetical protein